MTMNLRDPNVLTGMPVVGTDGDKLGKVDHVYLDNETSEPEWVAVKSGLLGNHISLVPLFRADFDGQRLAVPYGAQQIKDAPHQHSGRELTPDDERQLYQHYNLGNGDGVGLGDQAGEQGGDTMAGRDTAGPGTGEAMTREAMTRSEERMNLGAETARTGRARLRKHVVTETRQVDVPVSHEEVRLEREPITDADRGAATDGRVFSDQEHEVTLAEQRPVLSTEAVPVEQVRLGTETVTEQRSVSGEVRKEDIELDDPTGTNRTR